MSDALSLRNALRCARPSCACSRGSAVHCPNHPDDNPSFGVDERGGRVLFRCRAGCRQADVLAALRARGLWRSANKTASARQSPLEEARAAVIHDALAQPWAREGVLLLYELVDWLRHSRRKVAALREYVAGLGRRAENLEAAHEILSCAARLETLTLAIEQELDEVVAGGPRW